jgi:serine/threonine-protein kinase
MPDDELRSLAESRLGRVLRGKYRLERVLGLGGMAAVYAATHRNGKRFAVKMLHPQLSTSESIRSRFLREGYVANKVEHPGAVAVLDDDVAEDGSAFLVMELLEGSAVDEVAGRYPGHCMPPALATAIVHGLLEVLVAAHAKGIVHRDLKPANLFVTHDGRLEVLDFGIARLRDAAVEAHATQSGAVLGTPAFMAPEQALAEAERIDARTDLWAAGATLFTLLSGRLVHEADNAAQLMIKAATQKARPLVAVAPDVPASVAAVVDRALAFDPKERWESAQAMGDALAKAWRDATGEAIPPLPKTERVTGLESTVASDPKRAHDGSGVGFEPTLDAPKPALTTAKGVSSSATPTKRDARWGAVGIAIVGVAAAVTASVAWPRAHTPSSVVAAPAIDASAPRAGRAPANAEAAAAWEAALQAEHDGNESGAIRSLRSAIASDPSLGAAHLRLAIRLIWSAMVEEAHEEFRRALEHRKTLGGLDASLLEAWGPRFDDPPAFDAVADRMRVIADANLGDPYVQWLYGGTLHAAGHDPKPAFERAISADASFVPSYGALLHNAFYEGEEDSIAREADRCLKAAPSAITCIDARADVDNVSGDCRRFQADARRMIAIDPGAHGGYEALAAAMYALHEPPDAIESALQRGIATFSDEQDRRADELETQQWLALTRADFAEAIRAALAQVDLATTSRHGKPVHVIVKKLPFFLEANDLANARKLLERGRALWKAASTSERNAANESRLIRYSAQVGLISRDTERAEMAALAEYVDQGQKTKGDPLPPLGRWRLLYGLSATDPDGAREALDALAAARLTDFSHVTLPNFASMIGRSLAMTGSYKDAIPLLEREQQACMFSRSVQDADWHVYIVRDLYLLGLSREHTGDLAGAKAAYEGVLARWGQAKPKSVTADAARAGLARLAKIH